MAPNQDDADIVDSTRLALGVSRAREALLSRQTATGAWNGELRTNVLHDAEDLLLRQFLGIRTETETQETARWIRLQQRRDGAWSNGEGGGADLSITVAGYLVLRIAGDRADAEHIARARQYINESGGLAATSMFLRTWLAVFGLWSWRLVPSLPPQLIYGQRWPLSIYRFSSWVRTLVVPMMIVGALRPVRDLGVDLGEELVPGTPNRLPPPAKVLRAFRRLPFARHAVKRAEKWILDRQEADGSWFSSRPPVAWGCVALSALGYPNDHPVVVAAIQSLEGLTFRADTADGPIRRAVIFNGHNWDTAGAVIALTDAGMDACEPELARAGEYLLGQQVRERGDWSVARPHLETGGWPFFGGNQGYPDVDDTAMVVQALCRLRGAPANARIDRAVGTGLSWAMGMQCEGGGWAAFDADNTSDLAEKLLTYTTATDRPCAEITGHVLEALRDASANTPGRVRDAVDYLIRTQGADGSWPGRWMVHHIYGTSAALCGFASAGIAPTEPSVTRAVEWLESHQNSDGGWGEDLATLTVPDRVGHGVSTPSQTAWALLGLLAVGGRQWTSTRRGVEWLLGCHRADGTWDECQSVGVIGGGKVGYIPLRYDLSRLIWPTMALGRYLRSRPGAPQADGQVVRYAFIPSFRDGDH